MGKGSKRQSDGATKGSRNPCAPSLPLPYQPVIGIAGGIGSGKSLVARLFGELGGLVISSDDQVREAYNRADVKEMLKRWWGQRVIREDGSVNRRAIAAIVFESPAERRRLEALMHPRVKEMRDAIMSDKSGDPAIRAFIWDTPLLFETGLNSECNAVVFVDAPPAVRARRVAQYRGWPEEELAIREKSQLPLDSKRQMSDYVISNAADAGGTSKPEAEAGLNELRDQVRDVFSQILERRPASA